MKIYLVQHAEALPKDVDPERPLSEAGRRDAEHVAAFLRKAKVHATRVVHSGKRRASDTAAILASALARKPGIEETEGLNPEDSPKKFAGRIDELGDGTIIVSHLPFLSRLVSQLVAEDDTVELVRYEPGSVVCLEQDEAGAWVIAWMLRPELLGSS